MRVIPIVLLTAAASLAPHSALAHPHVWVEARAEVAYEGGRIVAVNHVWRFDEMFSAFASQGLDTDGDGTLSREELQDLAEVNVTSLHEYDFFTFMKDGEKEVAFGTPRDYWLVSEGGFLTLHFTLPLAEPAEASGPVVLDVFDPEYFVAFSLAEGEPVTLAGAPSGCSTEIERPAELDDTTAQMLAEIGPDTRELPEEYSSLTQGLSNRITIGCS